MKLISLGCNCSPADFIKKHFPSEYYPFDWIWSNIEFVLKTFETDSFEFTECEKLNPVWETNSHYTYIFNNNCKGGPIRKCSAICLHDANYQTPDTIAAHIPVINEKYKRRFARLYEALNSDDDIILIRRVLERSQGAVMPVYDSNETLNRLVSLLNNKFRARITLCVVDDGGFLDNSELHADIKVFNSFDELLPFIQSASQVLEMVSSAATAAT